MDSAQEPQSKPIDKWIPWMFVAFFAVVAAVNAVFVTVALETRTGVVTSSPYEQGIAYNKTLEEAAAQEKLGWKGTSSFKDGELRYELRGKGGKPISGAHVRAAITRPVTEGYDRDAVLAETKPGLYAAKLDLPMKGLWNVRVFSEWQDKSFQTDSDLTIP